MDKKFFEDVIYMFKKNRLKENFIKKNYSDFYIYIIDNYIGDSFLEKLYNYYIGFTNKWYCGKKTKFISFTKGYLKYCSHSCSSNSGEVRDKYRKSCEEKYGFDNPSKASNVKGKKEKTFNDRYGVSCYLQTKNVKDIIKNKYNVNNVFESDIIKAKIKETNLKKYGVDIQQNVTRYNTHNF